MIELLQFRHSPYNEKVRWALDLKHVPHVRRSLLPGPHIATVRRLTGRTQTPVLCVDGQVLDGSASIVDWLDEHWPEPPLLPADADGREAVRRIEARFDDDWVPRARRAVLDALLQAPGDFARVFGDGRSAWSQRLYACTVPLAAPLVRKGNGIRGQASVLDGWQAAGDALDFVAEAGAATGYLVGGRFTRADLSAAAGLAAIVDVPGSPMSKRLDDASPLRRQTRRFDAHPGTAWVRGIYARHRGATQDFDSPGARR